MTRAPTKPTPAELDQRAATAYARIVAGHLPGPEWWQARQARHRVAELVDELADPAYAASMAGHLAHLTCTALTVKLEIIAALDLQGHHRCARLAALLLLRKAT